MQGQALGSVWRHRLAGITRTGPHRELFGSRDNREGHASNEARKTGQVASRCREHTPFVLQVTAPVKRLVTSSFCFRCDSQSPRRPRLHGLQHTRSEASSVLRCDRAGERPPEVLPPGLRHSWQICTANHEDIARGRGFGTTSVQNGLIEFPQMGFPGRREVGKTQQPLRGSRCSTFRAAGLSHTVRGPTFLSGRNRLPSRRKLHLSVTISPRRHPVSSSSERAPTCNGCVARCRLSTAPMRETSSSDRNFSQLRFR